MYHLISYLWVIGNIVKFNSTKIELTKFKIFNIVFISLSFEFVLGIKHFYYLNILTGGASHIMAINEITIYIILYSIGDYLL